MIRHVINTISRTQGADAVFAAAEEMQRSRYAFDESVYNALLRTCFQVWRVACNASVTQLVCNRCLATRCLAHNSSGTVS